MELNYSRNCVYMLDYHVVWCTKYRRKLITAQLENILINLIKDISLELNFDIKEINTDKDHIHLLISLKPIHYIPNIIKILKGRTSKIILSNYKYLIKDYIWGNHLWNPSYFISTVSKNTEQQIRNYIKNQKNTSNFPNNKN